MQEGADALLQISPTESVADLQNFLPIEKMPLRPADGVARLLNDRS